MGARECPVRRANPAGSIRPAVFADDAAWREHLLRLFWLMFRREAFLLGDQGQMFHQIALVEGREWEAKVRQNLAAVVFNGVFPELIRALVAPMRRRHPITAPISRVREAALTFLYRLCSRSTPRSRSLPKRDPNYGGLSRLRDEIAERDRCRHDAERTAQDLCGRLRSNCLLPSTRAMIRWAYRRTMAACCRRRQRPSADRAILPDADFAPLFDRLARTEKDGRRVRINFRDLSVHTRLDLRATARIRADSRRRQVGRH